MTYSCFATDAPAAQALFSRRYASGCDCGWWISARRVLPAMDRNTSILDRRGACIGEHKRHNPEDTKGTSNAGFIGPVAADQPFAHASLMCLLASTLCLLCSFKALSIVSSRSGHDTFGPKRTYCAKSYAIHVEVPRAPPPTKIAPVGRRAGYAIVAWPERSPADRR
jgi:hypothetical protein